MPKPSAGILMYRYKEQLEVLLAHPGGPFWKNRDAGSWSIPKGEFEAGEELLQAAIREFEEETGKRPAGDFIALTTIRQKGHKTVMCWAVEDDMDPAAINSNMFEMEWPPKSGRSHSFPEIDKAGWFDIQTALQNINERQAAFIIELKDILRRGK